MSPFSSWLSVLRSVDVGVGVSAGASGAVVEPCSDDGV